MFEPSPGCLIETVYGLVCVRASLTSPSIWILMCSVLLGFNNLPIHVDIFGIDTCSDQHKLQEFVLLLSVEQWPTS